MRLTTSHQVARHHSPLRYPGGKAKLAAFVKALFAANGLKDGVYAEPYAGGASIALTLLFEEFASRVFLNDIDPAVFAFWHSVLNRTEELCRLVSKTKVTVDTWRRQRSIYLNTNNESKLAIGFAAFFLNRTNRSGIIASGGMIGGKQQAGQWKLDARYNSKNLVARIERVARYRDRIELSRLDALDFIARCATSLPERSLVYLDPPYYVKGQRRLYANFYSEEDHQDIAEALSEVPFRWITSYDNEQEIRQLYRRHRKVTYYLHYSAADRDSGTEVMFFSDGLKVPRLARTCGVEAGGR